MTTGISEHIATAILLSGIAALVLFVLMYRRTALRRKVVAETTGQRYRRPLVLDRDDRVVAFGDTGGMVPEAGRDAAIVYSDTAQVPPAAGPGEDLGLAQAMPWAESAGEGRAQDVAHDTLQQQLLLPEPSAFEAFERELEAAFEHYAAGTAGLSAIEEVLDRYDRLVPQEARDEVPPDIAGRDNRARLADAVEWTRLWVADRKRCPPASEGEVP